MESAVAPNGPGWSKLTEQTYMNSLELLKKNTQVFKGRHLIDGEWRDIAVKLISYDENSLKEVKLQLKIEDHPNIILLYDTDVIRGIVPYIYIAMELCSQTLKEFIEERKSIPLDFELYFIFAKQIVSAVDHIHQHDILHRDLKLENILLSSTKDNIRVADFGLSKQLLEGHSVATASFRGIGTDGYRAPELLHEHPQASYRSDSFSLGIVLAMLFSNGQHPFGSDPARWRTNIADNKGRDLSHIPVFNEPYHRKRALLVDLLEPCLQPNPRARPTPKEMLQHGFFSMTESPSAAPCNAFTVTGGDSTRTEMDEDAYTGDTIDQYLIAKKEKLKRLENNLAKALRNGQANHLQVLGELNALYQTDDLDVILPLAEYELVSKSNESCIEKVRRYVCVAGMQSADDVRTKGDVLYKKGQSLQSMILFKIAHDLHKEEAKFSPDHEAKWIDERVTDITNAINPLLKTGGAASKVAMTHGVRSVEEMLRELRALDGVTPSTRALHEISCLVNVTGNLNLIGESEKCIRYGEEGVALMRKQFGDGAVHYKDYGSVLNNLGNAYSKFGQHSKAQDCYTKAIETQLGALDYGDEAERLSDIESTQKNAR